MMSGCHWLVGACFTFFLIWVLWWCCCC